MFKINELSVYHKKPEKELKINTKQKEGHHKYMSWFFEEKKTTVQ